MAFPILTVLSAGVGIGQSAIQSMGSNAAIQASNKAARSSAKLDDARGRAEYSLAGMQSQMEYHWDRARVAQLRANEATNRADQAAYGQRMIFQATENLRINTEALRDAFVVEEGLRGKEVGMNYAYEAAASADQTNELVRQYMFQLNDRALQARQATRERENRTNDVVASMAYDEQRDRMKYQLEMIALTAQDAKAEAGFMARQGGGATARRLAMEGVKELGRKFGEIEQRSQQRASKVALSNAAFSSESALIESRAAVNIQDLRDRMAYQTKRFGVDEGNKAAILNDLVLPTFDLSKRQYSRELEGLQLATKNEFDNALTPYRMQEFMDPLKPMPGLKPATLGPTNRATESLGSMVGSALLGGVKGAMMGAHKRKDYDGNYAGIGWA